jgi:hypothetical protein
MRKKGYATRKVRAGKPVEDDMPIQYWHPDEPKRSDGGEVIDFLLAFTILMIVIAVLMFVWRKFS